MFPDRSVPKVILGSLHCCSTSAVHSNESKEEFRTLGFLAVGRRGHLIGAILRFGHSLSPLVTLSLISDPGASLRSRGSWSCYRQSDLDPVATVGARVEQRCLCILGLDPEPSFWMDGIKLERAKRLVWCPFSK